MAQKVVSEFDVGDSVSCDLCSTEFRGRRDMGGILVQSKAICPFCAPRYEAQLKQYGELSLLRARCPEGMTFHAWVMWLRGGNNKVTVSTLDMDDLGKLGG